MTSDAQKKTVHHRIIYVGDRRDGSEMLRPLTRAGYNLLLFDSIDHAVAYLAHDDVHVVILDQEIFIEVDGWSCARSFKLVRPEVCVVLLTSAQPFGASTPEAVDALIQKQDTAGLLAAMERITGNAPSRRC